MRKTHTLGISARSIPFSELRAFVEEAVAAGVPDNTSVNIKSEHFDHPGDPGEDGISLTWTTGE